MLSEELWSKIKNRQILRQRLLREWLSVPLFLGIMLLTLFGQQTAPNPEPRAGQPKSGTEQSKPAKRTTTRTMLLLHTDEACTVKVDGDEVAHMQAGDTKKVQVGLGQHLVEAVNEETAARWEQEVQVKTRAQVLVRITLADEVARAKEAKAEDAEKAGRQKKAEALREEELRQAKVREETQRRHQEMETHDDFTAGLSQWDAPAGWEVVKEKDSPALKVQGMGFLKKGEDWDNYKVEFEVKVTKEAAGWMVRAQDPNSFYLFKLSSDQAKTIPKNSLVKYVFSGGKYLNSLTRQDAPAAAGVTLLPFKVNNKDFYKVSAVVKGNAITHSINGVQVDSWTDDTFPRGRFGFNASKVELAAVRNVVIAPLD
jgi:hypothetical protein